jgi:hypothetical protein
MITVCDVRRCFSEMCQRRSVGRFRHTKTRTPADSRHAQLTEILQEQTPRASTYSVLQHRLANLLWYGRMSREGSRLVSGEGMRSKAGYSEVSSESHGARIDG